MDFIRPTLGSVQVFGESTRSNPAALKRVVALVEGASFYNHLSGYDNLKVLGLTANNYNPKRIEELLDRVGLVKTVFLSSHLLNEVEQICDRVAIIRLGELVREGKVTDLLAEGDPKVRVQAVPLNKAAVVLKDNWDVTPDRDWLIVNSPPMTARRL